MLYGLSVEKHAHWQFRILSRSTRIPVRSLLFSCFCMLIGTLLLFLVPNVMTLFTIVSTLAAIMVVFSWGCSSWPIWFTAVSVRTCTPGRSLRCPPGW